MPERFTPCGRLRLWARAWFRPLFYEGDTDPAERTFSIFGLIFSSRASAEKGLAKNRKQNRVTPRCTQRITIPNTPIISSVCPVQHCGAS